jgi:ubiquinone/menaquinone biosynthesis C-methylase UbiE
VNTDLIDYYRERATEYEKIYTKPERQADLQEASRILQRIFQEKNVFEIACGTGFWTERLAKTASSIVATDINISVLEIAKSKVYAPPTVTFEQADLFQLPIPAQRYKNLFGGFIWSHIPIQEIDIFLETLCRQIEPGGTIVFMDNNYVEGSNLPITYSDELGNTYQTRQLENGTMYEVLKNFPDHAFITRRLQKRTTDIQVIWLRYYWIAVCKNK